MIRKDELSIPWIILGGLLGIGYIIAIFYIMIKEKKNDRWLGLLFFAGPIGSIISYLLTKKENRNISKISLSLLIGFIIWIIIAIPLGINPFYQIFGYIHGWLNA